jgi:octaprenyl-diphosphate synthase
MWMPRDALPKEPKIISDNLVSVDRAPGKLPPTASPQRSALQLGALAPVADDLARVDALIRTRLDSDVALVRQVAEYLVAAGGKRLRPALLLLACGALGNRSEARIPLAAVVEFIHTATLLHDDVVDTSELRRGRTTANAAFGNAAAVLVGDFLYSRAFQMMVEIGDMRVMQVLAEATNTIAAGEVMQLMGSHDPQVDEARYLEVIRRKTAKLFEAATRLAAVLSNQQHFEEPLAEYGRRVGTAFQLVDDVLDYGGDLGKSLGDDLAEGKPTLPLIYAMRCGSAEQASVVRRAITEGGRADFPQVLDAIRACGALDYARAAAEREAAAAARVIAALPASAFKHSLLELASFSVTRGA